MSTSKYLNGTGLSEVWTNTKNYIASQLLGKSDVGHTHVKSEITDFPSLATVATSGSYNDLSNKPTIPTVNNATLTIQKNGTNVQTFTANQSTNATANITVPTKTSDLTNDNRYTSCLTNNSINFDWYSTYPGKVGIKVDNTWVGGIDTIKEQGNGYIRYSNGIQICWGSITWQSKISNLWGAIYESDRASEAYAKSFIETPCVSACIVGSSPFSIIESSGGNGTTTPIFYLCRGAPIDAINNCVVDYIAIGRWK